MVINGKELRARHIIENCSDGGFRAASYDLTIETFINPHGRLVEEYEIPPQGIIKIVSCERVAMPKDLIGYVLVKTSLCNEGILALNIGIVDPGFQGQLTSTLINFGKSKQRLRKGDTFSRLSVHKIEKPIDVAEASQTKEIVLRHAVDQVDQYLADSFLDIKNTANKAADKAFGQYKSRLLWGLPLLAFIISVLTLALNFGNMWLVQHYFQPKDQVRAEAIRLELGEKLFTVSERADVLQAELASMKSELQRLKSKK